MNKNHLILIKGDRRGIATVHLRGVVEHSVAHAIHAGYHIGQRVWLGQTAGRVVGYNIGAFGRFSGARYPLLVRTEFGVIKCSVREVAAA